MNGYACTTVAELVEQAGRRFRRFSLDTYPADHPARVAALETARLFVDDARRALALLGGIGVGKTGLAFAIGREIVDENNPVRFLVVHQWLARLRNDIAHKRTPDLDLEADAELLILDDLGVERPTDWAVETIATLVDTAHRNAVAIVATSNYRPGELAARLSTPDDPHAGQRIVSRLLEDALVAEIDAPDLRVTPPPTTLRLVEAEA
jgi:DNA replication protein DnaC